MKTLFFKTFNQIFQIAIIRNCSSDECNFIKSGIFPVFIENVGNLVCPASYDVGAHANVVLLSVTEGSDKVAKYPVMFRAADLVVVTKHSLIEHFDFSVDEVAREVKKLNPKAAVIALDSKTGEGLEKWLKFLEFKKEFR